MSHARTIADFVTHPEEWKALLTRRGSKDALGTDALLELVWPERR